LSAQPRRRDPASTSRQHLLTPTHLQQGNVSTRGRPPTGPRPGRRGLRGSASNAWRR